jgi:nucleoside-diphosphate-sugar epimerase
MILVTGGAGYVGSQLVHELLALGYNVRVVDTFWFGNPFESHSRLELIDADVRRVDTSWLDGVSTVIHLAGLSNDPTADFAPDLNSESNVLATRVLAQTTAKTAMREQREIRFLFASTCSVYYTSSTLGDVNVEQMTEETPVAPTANYSKTKRLAELELLHVAEQSPLFCPVILRKGTIFGPAPRMRFDLVVNTFTLHAWRKRRVTVHGHGEAWRPLLHVRDAVDAYSHLLWAPTEKVRCAIFDLVHKNYRVLELAHWVAEVLEQQRGVEIQVKRDRSSENGARSYYVVGDKITRIMGFRAERGTSEAILAIWDALERGEYGPEPENDPRFFNIRWLKHSLLQENNALVEQGVLA